MNAEALKKQLMEQNEMDGPVFKMKNDPRVTRIGRFLRRYSIDELPQLWNVLRGDMTIVGPRPPLVDEVSSYARWQEARLHFHPGLTCIWQVDGKLKNVSFADWMRMDLQYGRKHCFFQDLRLILRTAWVVIIPRGDH